MDDLVGSASSNSCLKYLGLGKLQHEGAKVMLMNLASSLKVGEKVIPRFIVCAKKVTLCCDTHGGESVHSNEGLCKVSIVHYIVEMLLRVKDELPLPVSSKLKHPTVIFYFYANDGSVW